VTDAVDRTHVLAEARARIEAADAALAAGLVSVAEWQHRITEALAVAYLIDGDPRWQSGFDGDAALWREARELVLGAVPRDGTFLDVGCANGHLMECLVAWAHERGIVLIAYGLELNAALADLARGRLPAWSDRIYTGNVTDWIPPQRFTYVRTGLEYVPPAAASALIRRLLDHAVAPDGRLIVGPMSDAELSASRQPFADAGVGDLEMVSATDRTGKRRHVVWTRRSSS
jgi:hypothetical protein